ncbi:restriction endonuclease subunit S [Streptococcus ilei]|uniref:restriction endonuclease subunit S n=1 Tax=Streptococcus ilei TaxID=1156431 RepID=UPI0003B9333C|nr:restriction endonuclease subunit S [Streptococcus ilei]AGY39970.1 type I restriction modification protein [Streptococcus ilei]
MVKIRLGDVIDFKNGKSIKKSDGIIPIYGGNGILGYTDKSNFSHTIVVGRVGAYCGSIHVEENLCWVSDNAIAGVPKEGQDLTYLYYVLKSLNLNSKQIGSSQPLITQSMLKDMIVDIEIDIEKQKIIANSISIIDQKIQINNQINQELEAMAKTLYDYWFVQFDFPDQNGKPYKSSGGKMVYHPELKREIPEGWGVDSLWNIANFYNGLAMQKYRPDTTEDDYLPVIKIREMMNGFSKDTEKARLDIPSEAVVERGDILFSWSATLEVIIWGKEKGALNQHIFKVTSDTYPESFIYFELKSYLKVFKAIAELRKTTMGHITQDHLKQAKIVVPPIEIISKLDAKLQPIMLKQQILENQNQELTQLRDWLLPMLMNGQVKVE